MRHHTFATSDTYAVALLMRPAAFDKTALSRHYVEPLKALGLAEEVMAVTLDMGANLKPSATHMKGYCQELLAGLHTLGVKLLICTDVGYFKVLSKKTQAEPHMGYCLPVAIEGFDHMSVVLSINYQQLVYKPDLQARLDLSLKVTADARAGRYQEPGSSIIHHAHYPSTVADIKAQLRQLLDKPVLACDIETYSLRFEQAGVASIAFAWSQHEGTAFTVDYVPVSGEEVSDRIDNQTLKVLLRDFFEAYQGKLIFHNAAYDCKVLVYNLWMLDPLDMLGLLRGLHTMTRNLDDTKIIAYLAYNSTAGNQLGLKTLAHEFAGNYAVDEISNVAKIVRSKLLQYNLVDTLSTMYVHQRDYPLMVKDQQEGIYKSLMLPSLKLIIQTELSGMPMDMARVMEVKAELQAEQDKHLLVLAQSPRILAFNRHLQVQKMNLVNATLKKKQHPLEHFADVVFNPNSNPQLQELLYEPAPVGFGLPVLDLTDSKQPATGADTIKKLLAHTEDAQAKEILEALIGYSAVNKILTAFIPSFEQALQKRDGAHYLHGSFNLGGTVSGRLSSSNPNLQQIPSNSAYGKLIKSCFKAPKGWLFVGADFNSLEDYISALTTQDPNKLDVYLKGFDGHCLRAAYYFRDQLPHIDLADPASVNSIKKTHPELRQDSKAPTFALTYQGTAYTLMSNLGWPEEKAKQVEAQYHELYKVSDAYVQSRLAQAAVDGFVEVAFGLRVRTPLLAQVLWGKGRIPYEAQAEGRTAGNALGQSYGLLNNRAAVAFMRRVWDSPHRHDIKPVALIHDAIYLMVRDDLDVLDFCNRWLIKEMQWQDLPEIDHPQVRLGAALDVFWPNWAYATTLPNNATKEQIVELCDKAKQSYEEAKRQPGN